MIKVIPAILAKSKEKFFGKVELVRDFAPEIQIDIMDGKFVGNSTWVDPEEISKIPLPSFEAHLMVANPAEHIKPWAASGASRIIFHFEATSNAASVIKKIKESGCRAGVAINPETPVEAIKELLGELDAVLVMGVNPGFSGQEFQESAVSKVAELRALAPDLNIEVDGGVSLENASRLAHAGASGLVVASAIFSDLSPKSAYENILKKANE